MTRNEKELKWIKTESLEEASKLFQPFSIDEIEKAIKDSKAWKEPGPGTMQWATGETMIIQVLHKHILEIGQLPKSFKWSS